MDFWDQEGGYYLNGTYYGDKNLLALAAAGQVQGSNKTAYNVDFLLERKVPVGGAVSEEFSLLYGPPEREEEAGGVKHRIAGTVNFRTSHHAQARAPA